MALRVSSAEELAVILNFQAKTSEAEAETRRLGHAVNEMTVEQLRAAISEQAKLINGAKDLEKRTSQIQRNWWRTQRVLRASALIFRNITIAGTALWAPLVAGAQSYAKEIEKIDNYSEKTSDAWLAQVRQLHNAQLRIGRTSAEVLLPYLEKVTNLAGKAAGYIEKHPGLIEAALKTGVAVTTVGVLGTLVTQGIKMVVDVKFVAASATLSLAARNMNVAADKMLAASTGQTFGSTAAAVSRSERLTKALEDYVFTTRYKKNVAGRWFDPNTGRYVSAGAVGASRLATGAAGLGGIGAGIAGVVGSYQLSQQLRGLGLGDILSNIAPLLSVAGPLVSIGANAEAAVNGLKKLVDKIRGVSDSASKGAKAVVNFTVDLERLAREGEGTRVILELQRSLVEASRKYEQDRADVIAESAKDAEKIQKRYSDKVSDAYESMNKRIEDITHDYNKASARAQEDYLISRQDALKDAHDKTVREEEDFRERLRKLRLDHEERVDALVRNRDALGLVKEERRYQLDIDEATRAHNIKVQREKQETRDRLAEIDHRYALARRRRYEDYVERLQEEKDRFEEAKKEAAKQRQEELKELQEAQKEKLEELRVAYEQEKREAVNAAYEKVVLLRGAYDAELRLRQQYHGLILQSTEDFLQRMLDSYELTMDQLKIDKAVPTRQFGGYSAGTGLHLLHSNEYVMSPGIVRAAEQAIGGKLSNKRLMNVLKGGGGTTVNIELPGGLVTMKMMKDVLRQNNTDFLTQLDRILT